MRIVVTGSSGFVGKHTAHALLAKGYAVVGYDIANGFDILDYRQLCDYSPRLKSGASRG